MNVANASQVAAKGAQNSGQHVIRGMLMNTLGMGDMDFSHPFSHVMAQTAAQKGASSTLHIVHALDFFGGQSAKHTAWGVMNTWLAGGTKKGGAWSTLLVVGAGISEYLRQNSLLQKQANAAA